MIAAARTASTSGVEYSQSVIGQFTVGILGVGCLSGDVFNAQLHHKWELLHFVTSVY